MFRNGISSRRSLRRILPLFAAFLATTSPFLWADIAGDSSVDTAIPVTRLKQASRDAPVATTIITRDEIKARGYQSFVDIFRDVPGFRVAQSSASDVHVSYHGTSASHARRMAVSINGQQIVNGDIRSIYWSSLPIDLDDIDKVIIVRDPNGVAFGDNALLASVDIRRIHPADIDGLYASVGGGSQNTQRYSLRYGSQVTESLALSVTANHFETDGYDEKIDEDAFSNDSFALNALYEFNPSTSFEFQASGYKADRNTFLGDVSFDVADYGDDAFYLSGKMKHDLTGNSHIDVGLAYNKVSEVFEFGVSGPGAYYRPELREIFLMNPDHADTTFVGGTISEPVSAREQALVDAYFAFLNQYGASAFEYVSGYTDENIQDSQATSTIEYEASWNQFLMSVGGEFVDVNVESRTFLKDDVSRDYQRVFGQGQYQGSFFTINAGVLLEQADAFDGTFTAWSSSFNWHIDADQSIRFAWNNSFRLPSVLESERFWSYHVDFLAPTPWGQTSGDTYFVNEAPSGREEERIESRSIGYVGRFFERKLYVDVKAFNDVIKNPLTDPLFFLTDTEANGDDYHLEGAETEIKWTATEDVTLRLVYSYLDSDSNSIFERSLYSRHAGSASTSWRFLPGKTATISYYGNSSLSGFTQDLFVVAVAADQLVPDLWVQFVLEHPVGQTDGTENTWESGTFVSTYDHPNQFYLRLTYDLL